jgi:serine/threonine protein kinase
MDDTRQDGPTRHDLADDAPVSMAGAGMLPEAERYEARSLLGRGGMGEVHLCLDRRIGRQVALKRRHPGARPTPDADRFLREICVQGQLEHPSIVPLYDLSESAGGDAYFTMKHVRGHTLRSIVSSLQSGDRTVGEQYSPRKLLGAFSSVCLAVAFAHRRGVVHRDLKPDNIMLGDFGEVYVLDWGVAKIADGEPLSRSPPIRAPERASETEDGSLIGTPGYMAPEQCCGDVEAIDARADVYALGAILFEILALCPLHEGRRHARIESTLTGADARVHVRAPEREAPPELEAVCVEATALEPINRKKSAREMHDAVEKYLSHDRNLELRRTMAREHAQAASAAARRALGAVGPEADERRKGLVEAGRALALDPGNEEAKSALLRLLTEPPREPPVDVKEELEASMHQRVRVGNRLVALAMASGFFYMPLYLWMGVRSWTAFGLFYGILAVGVVVGLAVSRMARPSGGWVVVTPAIGMVMVASATCFFGPFISVPCLAAIGGMAVLSYSDRFRAGFCVLMVMSVVVPALLGWFGVLPEPYVFDGTRFSVTPVGVHFPAGPTFVVLLVSNVGFILMGMALAAYMRSRLTAAERQLLIQAWQLRELVPRAAQPGLGQSQARASAAPGSRATLQT